MGSLTLLLVVALTLQLAPMVAQAGQTTRMHEQVRLAEPMRMVVGVPARRQGEKPDKVSVFARLPIVPARVWTVQPGVTFAHPATTPMHLHLEMLVSLPPPAALVS